MFLGIEIGGTKLQLAVSSGDGLEFAAFRRLDVNVSRGAAGIREQIAAAGGELVREFGVRRIGIGFGGPVDAARGITTKSHQIDGWEAFPLGPWCQAALHIPTVIGNDCDVATLAEAQYGAGRGASPVFYVTVGTGVGGGCVIDGRLLGRGRPAIAEIGHLRPGLDAVDSRETVESIASGWGIAATARRLVMQYADSCERDHLRCHPLNQLGAGYPSASPEHSREVSELLAECEGDAKQLTTLQVANAARRGNAIASKAIACGVGTLGWALAQVITLLAPQVIVVGGGVSLMGDELFFAPLRAKTAQYVFPPLAGSYEIVPAQLGERVVVYGALALAACAGDDSGCSG